MTGITDLILRAENRRDQWMTIPVRTLPDPYMLDETTLLGSYSYTKLSTRKRLIVKSESIKLSESIIETPSAIARDYLKHKYKRGPIISHVQADALRDSLESSPNYAKPGLFEHGYYIDIKSAYWSIMAGAGWNVDYWPGKWLSAGTPPDDFSFKDHKVARNCLVSAGIPGTITRYQPRGVFDEIAPGNPLANVSLYKLINDILNSIASMAIDLGAIYVNTDGYIAPDKHKAALISQLILDWGLTPSVKAEGAGDVRSSGAYLVGSSESVPHKMRKGSQPVKTIHLPRHWKWLQKSFAFWVRQNT